MTQNPAPIPTSFLARPGGRVAFDVAGSGPLVVLVPGMGDVRASYRHVVTDLRQLGYRVAVTDLRGHGESDTTFAAYGDVQTGEDLIALVEHLGGPAVLVGNSMGAGAAAWAAAERPDVVAGLVLIGPFVRDGATGPVKRLMFRVAMAPMWANRVWRAYLPTLYAGRRPEDLETYLDTVAASLAGREHARAFARTTRTTHAAVEARLGQVHCPTLVVMGELDPDFPDPRAEAQWIADQLGAGIEMVADAGHYPQSQQPSLVLAAVAGFLMGVAPRA